MPAQNFDTFPRAMLQFLAMNTFKWVDVMRLATAITEEGSSPGLTAIELVCARVRAMPGGDSAPVALSQGPQLALRGLFRHLRRDRVASPLVLPAHSAVLTAALLLPGVSLS